MNRARLLQRIPQPSGDTLQDGLVAYYPLDGDVLDYAGSNDGTIDGNPQFVTGITGQGLQFDGNDRVNCGSALSQIFDDGIFTVSAWVNPYISGILTIIESRSSIPFSFALDGNRVGIETDSGTKKGSIVVNNNVWSHVVVSHIGASNWDFWVNGVQDSSVTSGAPSGTSNVAIGVNQFAGGIRYFYGIIDQLRVYDRVLIQDEIQQLNNSQI